MGSSFASLTAEGEALLKQLQDPKCEHGYMLGVMPNDCVRLELWQKGKVVAYVEWDEEQAEKFLDTFVQCQTRIAIKRENIT